MGENPLSNIMIRRKVKVNKIKKGNNMKKKEFYDLAAEMEEACGDWENSEGLSEEALESLISKVEAMAAKEEMAEKDSARPKKIKHFQLKKRYILILAAALTLVLGMGVVGDRAWIVDSNDLERDSEITTKINNEEKDSILREEEAIYQEIVDKLGIVPMWLGYVPDGMELDSYTVMESAGWAYINYLYQDKVVSIQMAKNDIEISGNVQPDGQSRKLENIENIYGYEIEAYCIDEEHQNYSAGIKYGNGYYKISGFFEEEEFLEILNGIYFKNL